MIRPLVSCLAPAGLVVLLIALVGRVDAALLSYEGFDYPNAPDPAALTDKNGGSSWGGDWFQAGTNNAVPFTVSQDDTSLNSAAFPFTPIGDRALAAVAAGSNHRVDRYLGTTFDLGAEGGVLYASFLMKKLTSDTANTSGDNQEFIFTTGAIETGMTGAMAGANTVRIGSTSAELFFIDAGGQTSGPALTLGTTYFLTVKIESHSVGTPDSISVNIYDPSETVPAVEPGSWDISRTVDSAAILNGIRFWVGGATPSGEFDEIRIGTTWGDVAVVPEPHGLALAAFGLVSWNLIRRRIKK